MRTIKLFLLILFLGINVDLNASTSTSTCPDSTKCHNGIIVFYYTNLPGGGSIDSMEFMRVSTKFGVTIDSIIGNAVYMTKPAGLSCSDTLTKITYYNNGSHVNPNCYDDTPVPVELVEFTASWFNNEILIEWATASEYNNSYFILERTIDGTEWIDIAHIPSQDPFSNQLLYYDYTDRNVYETNTYYYRLIQYDFDNQFDKSNTIGVYGRNVSDDEILFVFDILGKYYNQTSNIKIIKYKSNKIRKIIIINK